MAAQARDHANWYPPLEFSPPNHQTLQNYCPRAPLSLKYTLTQKLTKSSRPRVRQHLPKREYYPTNNNQKYLKNLRNRQTGRPHVKNRENSLLRKKLQNLKNLPNSGKKGQSIMRLRRRWKNRLIDQLLVNDLKNPHAHPQNKNKNTCKNRNSSSKKSKDWSNVPSLLKSLVNPPRDTMTDALNTTTIPTTTVV